MQMYNLTQLTKYSEKFLKDNYNLSLDIPLKLNGRLKTCCGRFISTHNRTTGKATAKSVEMNKFFVENNEPTLVLDVLRHELVHYALFTLGKPHKDGHLVFENELKRLGIVSQSTINKYTIASKPVRFSIYECSDCKYVFKRKRALPNNGRNHRCTCKGRLIDKGKQVISA